MMLVALTDDKIILLATSQYARLLACLATSMFSVFSKVKLMHSPVGLQKKANYRSMYEHTVHLI